MNIKRDFSPIQRTFFLFNWRIYNYILSYRTSRTRLFIHSSLSYCIVLNLPDRQKSCFFNCPVITLWYSPILMENHYWNFNCNWILYWLFKWKLLLIHFMRSKFFSRLTCTRNDQSQNLKSKVTRKTWSKEWKSPMYTIQPQLCQ